MTAPWIAQQTQALLAQRGHAWLLMGPSGLGQYSLAMALVRAWLCEQPDSHGACGTCGSCHGIDVRTHADLCVLMPETKMLELGWPLSEKAQSDIDDKKRKPSKEIRVDAMRDAVEFTQRTSARGRGKAVLIFPAEDMNGITANALLKTLEEPPGDVKFVLATESAHQLLPTIRSRCLTHTMVWPDVSQSEQWLIDQGLSAPHAQQLLKATGGRPQDALEFSQSGRDPSVWAAFPKAMSKGDTAFVKEWSGPELIDALHKLCHDVMAVSVGSEPRFFLATDLPKAPTIEKTSSWSQALAQSRRTMDHPYNAGLMQEALVSQAQTALH